MDPRSPGSPRSVALAILCFIFLGACAREEPPAAAARPPSLPSMIELVDKEGAAPTDAQGVEFTLTTPERHGVVDFYRLVGGDLAKLERVPFHQSPVKSFVQYRTPATASESVLLAHVSTLSDARPGSAEYVCMARIPHTGNRHSVALNCDIPSTVTFYMAAVRNGQSGAPPFHDIRDRLPRWEALYGARSNDLIAFLVSMFGTVQNALLDMGRERFSPNGQSIRPVMESLVAQALEQYQRNGQLSATQLVQLADEITGGSLPLARLGRFAESYASVAYVEDVTLSDPHGHLTRRDRAVDLPTLQAELQRFFVRGAPLELSDPRTHVPQGVRHERSPDGVIVSWQPLPHMDGYNVYLNGEYLRATRQPRVLLPPDSIGTVMIRAVGYGGEYDGQRHALAEQSAKESPLEPPA